MFKIISARHLTLIMSPFVLALALAMDIYVPAIPKLTTFLNVPDTTMLLTLNLFMFTAGIMQLVIGPMSDSIGRRVTAYWVIFFFAIGCLICSFANSIIFLILGRIIQAIGSCGMMVLGFTVVRDCFEGSKSAAVYSYLNGIIAFSPMFAPFIGSYLDLLWGWRSTFLSLLLVALAAWVSACFFLPETLPKEKRSTLLIRGVLVQYKKIFITPLFAIYNLVTCFGLVYLYLFCALSPYLIIRDLHVPEQEYGFYFCYMGFSFFFGSILCSQLVGRLGMYKTCVIGLVITLLGGVWMLVWHLESGLTLNGFTYPMLLVGIGGTFCMGAGNGGLMWPFEHHIGAAAALGGSLRYLLASVVGIFVLPANIQNTLPLAIPSIVFSVIGLTLFMCMAPMLQDSCPSKN